MIAQIEACGLIQSIVRYVAYTEGCINDNISNDDLHITGNPEAEKVSTYRTMDCIGFCFCQWGIDVTRGYLGSYWGQISNISNIDKLYQNDVLGLMKT